MNMIVEKEELAEVFAGLGIHCAATADQTGNLLRALKQSKISRTGAAKAKNPLRST